MTFLFFWTGLKACLADYAWSRFKRVLDIGGANGSVLAGLLKQDSHLTGVLFDQKQVGTIFFWRAPKCCQQQQSRLTILKYHRASSRAGLAFSLPHCPHHFVRASCVIPCLYLAV